MASGLVKVEYISSNDMLADGLTKPLSKERHDIHWEKMRLLLSFELKKSKRKFDDITL